MSSFKNLVKLFSLSVILAIFLNLINNNQVFSNPIIFKSKYSSTAVTRFDISPKISDSSGQFQHHTSAFLKSYLKLGTTIYHSSLESSKKLDDEITKFLSSPTQQKFAQLKETYRKARIHYQQSEVFRFANPEVDELEGRVNAWPVDESYLDYVAITKNIAKNENSQSSANTKNTHTDNIIASSIIKFAGSQVKINGYDTSTLRSLHELAGDESKVVTGFHAIEFLLWGQDLNGFKFGAGNRQYTDYLPKNCSGGFCQQRRKLLQAVSNLLVSDLQQMYQLFSSTDSELVKRYSKQPATQLLTNVFSGLGSLAYGELAGERIQLGLLLNDPEEEHDCFSDLTHLSHFQNLVGISKVIFFNEDFNKPKKHSLYNLIKLYHNSQANNLFDAFNKAHQKMTTLYNTAEKQMSYDMMLDKANPTGKKILTDLVSSLIALSDQIKKSAEVLKLNQLTIEGSDSLDNPKDVLSQL